MDIPSSMRALQWSVERGTLELVTVDAPVTPAPEEVIVKIAYAGVCGTDLHVIKKEFPTPNELILGHENTGTVAAFGNKVSGMKVGDRVGIGPIQNRCNNCRFCFRGIPQCCTHWGIQKFTGLGKDGGMADYCRVNAVQVFHIPDDLPLKVAVLAEPFSCILNGDKIIGQQPQDTRYLIMGAGIAGLSFASLLHFHGFRNVTITQRSEFRRKMVAELGLGYKIYHPDELNDLLKDKDLDEEGFDVIIDTTGNPSAIDKGFLMLCKGGTMYIYGCCPSGTKLNLEALDFSLKQKNVKGIWLNNDTYHEAVALVNDMWKEYLRFEKLQVEEFSLEQHKEAFDKLNTGQITKAVFRISGAE